MDSRRHQDNTSRPAGGFRGVNHFAHSMAMNEQQQQDGSVANDVSLNMPPSAPPSRVSGPLYGTDVMIPSGPQYFNTPSNHVQDTRSYNLSNPQSARTAVQPSYQPRQDWTQDQSIERRVEAILRGRKYQPTLPEARHALHQTAIHSRSQVIHNTHPQPVQMYGQQIPSLGQSAHAYMANQRAPTQTDASQAQKTTGSLGHRYSNTAPYAPAMNQQAPSHVSNYSQRQLQIPQGHIPANSQQITNYGVSGAQNQYSRSDAPRFPQKRNFDEWLSTNQPPLLPGQLAIPKHMASYRKNAVSQFSRPVQAHAVPWHNQRDNASSFPFAASAASSYMNQSQHFQQGNLNHPPYPILQPATRSQPHQALDPVFALPDTHNFPVDCSIAQSHATAVCALSATYAKVEVRKNSKALDKFIYFPKLEIELRVKIFKLAEWNLGCKQALHIFTITQIGNEISFFTTSKSKYWTKACATIRHVNHEARDAVKSETIYLNNIQNTLGLTVPFEFQPMRDTLVFNVQQGMDKVRAFHKLIGAEASSKIKNICKLMDGYDAHIWNGDGGCVSRPEDLSELFVMFPGLESLIFLPVNTRRPVSLVEKWKFGGNYNLGVLPNLTQEPGYSTLGYYWRIGEFAWKAAWKHYTDSLNEDSPVKEKECPDFGLGNLAEPRRIRTYDLKDVQMVSG